MPYSRTHLATTFPGFGARVNIAPRNRPPRVKSAYSESLAPDQFLPLGPGLPDIQVRWSPSTAPNASTAYADITPFVRSAHIQRGRNDELGRFDRGICDLLLDNRVRNFDPDYAGGLFYPNVKPLRRVQVRVRWNGVIYDRFTGYTGFELPQRYAGPDAVVPVSCFDGFGALALAQMPLATSRPAELSGARVNAFLDVCGWPAGERTIQAGVADLAAFALGTDMTCLGHLLDVQDAENGAMFIDRSGWFVFQDRHHRNVNESASRQTFATVGDSGLHYQDVDVRHGGFLWNGAQVTPASGNVQEWRDTAAQTDYYPRVFNRTLPSSSEPDALSLAQAIVSRNKTPQRRCYSMRVIGAENSVVNWPAFLGLEISHHVTVRVTPPAQTGTDVFEQDIEGVEETIQPGSYDMSFPMSPHNSTAYWKLGHAGSQLGTNTLLNY